MSRFIRIFAPGDVTLSCSDERRRKRERERKKERKGFTGEGEYKREAAEDRFDEDP